MKRIIIGFIIVTMCIVLIGCQGSSQSSTESTPAADQSSSQSSTGSTPATDAPVLKRIAIDEGLNSSGAVVNKMGAKSVQAVGSATGPTADYYTGLGESVSLHIEIINPSGYSISRFKINGTAFTTGSFTSDPIQPGQTTTVIHTALIALGNTAKTETYTISDIKYVVEIGETKGAEKDAVINADSVSSTKVMIGFSGSGTANDPYLIENVGQLKAVARCTNGNIGGVDGYNGKYLKLTADLDLTGENWAPIGTFNYDSIYNYCFKGSFDGGGKTISNLRINSSLLKDIGLFGYVYAGTIKNTVLINSQITNTIFNGRAGGIAGTLVNGLIRNCSNAGSISVTSSSSSAAGIVGSAGSNSTVSGCCNTATISSGSSSAADHMSAGGIAGLIYGNSNIQNCFNAGSVTAQGSTYNEVGGIIPRMYSGNSVSNCYNIGTISVSNTGFSYCTTGAGIVGVNEGSATNNVWLEGSAGAISSVGTGSISASKTAADMKLQATYTDIGWDFNTEWKISTGEYPKLVWQP